MNYLILLKDALFGFWMTTSLGLPFLAASYVYFLSKFNKISEYDQNNEDLILFNYNENCFTYLVSLSHEFPNLIIFGFLSIPISLIYMFLATVTFIVYEP